MAFVITGYGYRKNCFGATMFYEDEQIISGVKTGEKVLRKALELSRKNMFFSFKIIDEETTECWAVHSTVDDMVNCEYTVQHSERWNSTDAEVKMKYREIREMIVKKLEEKERAAE